MARVSKSRPHGIKKQSSCYIVNTYICVLKRSRDSMDTPQDMAVADHCERYQFFQRIKMQYQNLMDMSVCTRLADGGRIYV